MNYSWMVLSGWWFGGLENKGLIWFDISFLTSFELLIQSVVTGGIYISKQIFQVLFFCQISVFH